MDRVEKFCIGQGYTIREAIERIDESKNRAVIVLNAEQRVVGIISQGDIIRALLSGKSLYARIDTMLRPDFYYLNKRDLGRAYSLFKKIKITLLPVVDEWFILKSIITMDDIYQYLEEK